MKTISKVDKRIVRRSFAASSQHYDQVAALQRNVAYTLLNKVDTTTTSKTVLDIGCGTGFFTQLLNQKRLREQVIALDLALPMLDESRNRLGTACHYVCADAEHLPIAQNMIDEIYSNLAFQWCCDLNGVFRQLNALLKRHGKLCFSTFGPSTLHQLKTAWLKVDDFSHVNDFVDINDIKIMLEINGFTSINIEEEMIDSRYPDVMSLMRELKDLGAHNATHGRNRGLTGKTKLLEMIDAYAASSDNGIVASYQILYVSAIKNG